jgi:hypothetical protein
MDELVKAVSQRTGLSEEQSRQAAQAVLDFLMTKLPPPLAEQIKGALSGKAPDMTEMGKNLGGMLGKR